MIEKKIYSAVFAGLLMTIMPETHKKVLPTTLDEGESFGSEKSERSSISDLDKKDRLFNDDSEDSDSKI